MGILKKNTKIIENCLEDNNKDKEDDIEDVYEELTKFDDSMYNCFTEIKKTIDERYMFIGHNLSFNNFYSFIKSLPTII